MIVPTELDRVAFVLRRDGEQGAIDFCKQGLLVYRKALAQRNNRGHRCGYGQAFRRELVKSLIVYRKFLMRRNEYNNSIRRIK